MKKIALFLLVFFNVINLFAFEYKIQDTKYLIKGITREQDLKRIVPINTQKVFSDETELFSYVNDLQQQLYNTRNFNYVKVDFTYDVNTDKPYSVHLVIITEDTKHFLLLPYPKYSNNDGFTIKLKVQDINFLGTLSPLEADISFRINQKNGQTLLIPGATFDYSYPFKLGIIDASWNNSLTAEYTIGTNEFEWNVNTGIKLSLPFEFTKIQLELMQGAVQEYDYVRYGDETYFTEKAELSVPLIIDRINNWGDIVYTPYATFIYNWDKDGINPNNEDLSSPEIKLSHKLSTERINWIENFRQGFSLSISQSASYDFLVNKFKPSVSAEIKAFKAFKYIGINARLYAFAYNNYSEKIGERIRGVIDDQYFAKETGYGGDYACKPSQAIILNLDIPIHLFTTDWESIGWDFLKSFNFELQFVPFIDMAICSNKATGSGFDFKDGFFAAGFEVLCYPQKWRGIVIRGSLGIDLARTLLKDYMNMSWRNPDTSSFEVTIGIGLFY